MPVNSKNPEYNKWSRIWDKTRDGISGQEAVKDKGSTYLPKHDGQSDASYNAYKTRAQYINFVGRTLNVFIGQLFRKNPMGLDALKDYTDNINLSGSSFYYFSRDIARETMSTNRVAVLVNYSEFQKRPYLTMYQSESIINWQTEIIDSVEKLSRVILEGKIDVVNTEDIYQPKQKTIWKELYLEDGICKSREWERIEKGSKDEFKIIDNSESIPLMNDKPLTDIPIFFITSNGINTKLSKSLMTDFVNMNLGHYINSADNENRLHYTGAATAILRGWSKDKAFPIGGAAEFSESGGAEWMTVASDAGLKEEMRHKEEQIAALGSSVLSGKGRYVASAETANITSEGEYATLGDISKALSDCMTIIMSFFAEWAGVTEEIKIEYNSDFKVNKIDPQMLTVLMGAVQSGRMSEEVFFYNLQGYEMYPEGLTFEDEQAAIEEDQKKVIAKRDNNVIDLYNKTNQQNNSDQNMNDNQINQGGNQNVSNNQQVNTGNQMDMGKGQTNVGKGNLQK